MIALQLNPPLPMTTPKGDGLAHVMLDYGPEHNLYWVVFQQDTGECWTWANPQVRAQKNITGGRLKITPITKESLVPARHVCVFCNQIVREGERCLSPTEAGLCALRKSREGKR